MRLLLVNAILCAISSLTYTSSIQKRIIGGKEVEEPGYPWAASIKGINPKTKSVTYCGSTVVADQWLLTAAHCFWAGTKHPTHLMKPENWKIQAGSVDIELGARAVSNERNLTQTAWPSDLTELFKYLAELLNKLSQPQQAPSNSSVPNPVARFRRRLKKKETKEKPNVVKAAAEEIFLHPKYTPDDLEYDIALVKLSEKLTLESKKISLAKLPPPDKPEIWPPVRSMTTFVGWGCTKLNGGPTSRLRVVSLRVLPNDDCSELYNHGAGLNSDHEFCAGYYKSDVGICAGDSGSGLIYLYKRQPVVVGVASATHGQHPGDYPGLFTRVASFTDWITKTMKENS